MKYFLLFLIYLTILFSQEYDSYSWSEPKNLTEFNFSGDSKLSESNSIVKTGTGKLYLFYEEFSTDLNNSKIKYRILENIDSWSEEIIFEPELNSTNLSNPVIAIDLNEVIHIVWQDNVSKKLKYCFLKDDVFSEIYIISNINSKNNISHFLTVDAKNRVHYFWNDLPNENSEIEEIYYLELTDPEIISEPILISEEDNVESIFPNTILSDYAGDNFAVTWTDINNETKKEIKIAVTKNGGKDWEKLKLDLTESSFNSNLIINRYGDLILNYQTFDEFEKITKLFATSSNNFGLSWETPKMISDFKENVISSKLLNGHKFDEFKIIYCSQNEFEKYSYKISGFNSQRNEWKEASVIIQNIDSENYNYQFIESAEDKFIFINELIDSLSGVKNIYSKFSTVTLTNELSKQNTKKENNYNVKVYPNPAVSNISISFDLQESRYVEIRIYNILGEKVRSLKASFNSGKNFADFNLENLHPGIYLYSIITNNRAKTGKFTLVQN